MNRNPEWIRNIWSEFSNTRVVMMPAVLVGIYFIVGLTANTLTDFFENAWGWSLAIAGLLLFFWGVKITSEAVIAEMNNRTWSQQRLSQITPLEMTIGKLFGSSVYPWYGALISLSVALVCVFFLPEPFVKLRLMVNLILRGILTQSLTLNFSLMGVKKNRDNEKLNSGFYYIFTIIIGMFFFSVGANVMDDFNVTMRWFYFEVSTINFSLYTLVFFTVWSVVGAYQNMRTELQYTNGTTLWYLFLGTTMVYLAGVTVGLNEKPDESNLLLALYTMGALGVAIYYYLLFNESKNLSDLRRMLQMVKMFDKKALSFTAPLFLITFPVIVFLGLAAVGYHAFLLATWDSPDSSVHDLSFIYPISILLFMLRDTAIIFFQNIQRKAERADVSTLVYLMLLYGLLPALLHATEIGWLAYLFYPHPEAHPLILMLSPLIQFVMVYFLLQRSWFRANDEIVEAD